MKFAGDSISVKEEGDKVITLSSCILLLISTFISEASETNIDLKKVGRTLIIPGRRYWSHDCGRHCIRCFTSSDGKIVQTAINTITFPIGAGSKRTSMKDLTKN